MNKITIKQKKLLLAVHLVFSSIMLGSMVVFLVLSITAAGTKDEGVFRACYVAMHALADSSVRASTFGTIVTGVLLSVLTHWGLLNYYWIIAKELLSLVTIVVGLIGIHIWTTETAALAGSSGLLALHSPDFLANRLYLFAGIAMQIAALAGMFLLSVYKPWGKRAA